MTPNHLRRTAAEFGLRPHGQRQGESTARSKRQTNEREMKVLVSSPMKDE
jgi:hypothetical protein